MVSLDSVASYHYVCCYCVPVVGSYRDEAMATDLVPCVETLAPELLDLLRLVFRANHKERSTALELLSHPLIINGRHT